MPSPNRAFTLVELLVVVAIIVILATILFPVFAQAREKARSVACLSNQKQIGTAVQMYVQDYDETIFFRSTGTANLTRIGVATSGNALKWWNQLMAYVKNNQVFTCPSDPGPTPSADVNGNKLIRRSYIAVSAAESLRLSQIDVPTEITVFVDKWNVTPGATQTAITDSWIEPFNGDFDYYPTFQRMFKAGDRHQLGVNITFFDGHAKWMKGQALGASKDMTGCSLVNAYPTAGMCDIGDPGCTDKGTPDNTDPNHPIADWNICNTFSWP